MLQMFDGNSPVRKTHLQAASRVRWDSFLKYLDWLKEHNYVEFSRDGKSDVYRLTYEGYTMQAELQGVLTRFDYFPRRKQVKSSSFPRRITGILQT